MKTKALHTICFALLLGILWLPLLQEATGVFQEKPLAGVENPQDTVMLTGQNWFSKKFQENYVTRQYQWMGLRPSMVRLRNQVDYSIFREPYYSVLVGRDGELFGRASLEAIQGKEFVGQAKVDYNSRNTAILQNHLAQRGVQMLTVITPNKLQCMTGDLPGREVVFADSSNYAAYSTALLRERVNLLELATPITNWIATEPHRVFPRTGTHWTDYGAFLAANVIIAEMERLKGQSYIHPTITSFESSFDMRDTDADAGDLMNLMCNIPPAEVAYPILRFDTAGKVRPRVLVIGDSFWWKIYNQNIHQQVFAPGSQYRYYNYECFSDQWQGAKYINDFDLKSLLEQIDFVILCVNTDNLDRYPFEFVDQVLGLYYR